MVGEKTAFEEQRRLGSRNWCSAPRRLQFWCLAGGQATRCSRTFSGF